MIRPFAAGAGLACAVILAAGVGAHAGPSMSTNWKDTNLSQDECMRQAERVMRGTSLGKDIDIVGQSVFGQDNGYTAVCRCITEKGIIYFVVGGPTLDEARRFMRSLFDNF